MRENEDIWYGSFKRQVKVNESWINKIKMMFSYTTYKFYLYSKMQFKIAYGYDIGTKLNETLCKLYYRRHNAHVLQNAPKKQLLVFNIKDGWDPLCQFLGQPVPGTPFPHKNKNASITNEQMKTNATFLQMQFETKMSYFVILFLIVAVIFYQLW
uniref:Uncharacterized LOC100176603 n=2 Tax=Ciona intestinalis TaxID=7719 RepID=H2XVH0_CIOIN